MDWSSEAHSRHQERERLLKQTPEAELLANYRALYGLGPQIGIEQVHQHLALEGALTDRLLVASLETRPQEFEACYSALYAGLSWLNNEQNTSEAPKPTNPERYRRWTDLMHPGASVYEVGSGQGNLARHLAQAGYSVVATEITSERGQRAECPNLIWHETDGVRLDRMEAAHQYDYVISDQVFEHLHPDDRLTHLTSAKAILKPGGVYLLATPHAHAGPTDVTSVIPGANRCLYMHLQEETYASMARLSRAAGFSAIEAVGTNPFRRGTGRTFATGSWLGYQRLAERIEALLGLSRPARVALRNRWSRISRLESSLWVELHA